MLATTNQNSEIVDPADLMHRAGQAANQAAGRGVFADYQDRKAINTLNRQANDLVLFAEFLQSAGVPAGNFSEDPQAWRGVTWGLVAGFIRWQLAKGYAVPTVNVRLSTVKRYAALATQAGALDPRELAMIKTINGFQHKEVKRIDETRETKRIGSKKAQPVSISPEQARQLKAQPNTPQGRRDALLICLLVDHGLRVGEVAMLTIDNFDLKAGELRFYRPKVDKLQTHRLSPDTLQAAKAYLLEDAPAIGRIWRGSRKGNHGLTDAPMCERTLTERVGTMGDRIGLPGLSAHDCRHYWATAAVRNGTQLDRLQDAGGWASLAMPMRYVEAAAIANQGVNLGL